MDSMMASMSAGIIGWTLIGAALAVSTEEFTNDFINAIRDGKGDLLRRRYRDVDILMADDIQFLEN